MSVSAATNIPDFVRSLRAVIAKLVEPRPLTREHMRSPEGQAIPKDGIEVLWHDDGKVKDGELPNLIFRMLTRDEPSFEVIMKIDMAIILGDDTSAGKRYLHEQLKDLCLRVDEARFHRSMTGRPLFDVGKTASAPTTARKPMAHLIGKALH